MSRPLLSALLALALAAAGAPVAGPAAAAAATNTFEGKAPLRYLVTMRSGLVGAAALPAGVKTLRRLSPRTAIVTATPAALRAMRANRAIAEVVPDRLMHHADLTNDPRLGEQWDLAAPDSASVGIGLAAAWATTRGVSSVHVAVLDTGILADHPDLNGQWSGGYDMIADITNSNDGDGRDADPTDPGDYGWGTSSWHGSHVAGTIAANDNNGEGVTGIAPGVTITPVRVLGSEGGYYSDVIDGIRWAAGLAVADAPLNPNPADVINMSIGGYGDCFAELQSAVDDAIAAGTVVVVAAGNSGMDPASFSPANCDGVITVAATGPGGAPAWYTNRGASVEITAPGGDTSNGDANGILSSVSTGETTPNSGVPGYAFYQGTSMATPHVAAVVALMRSANPDLPAEVIADIIASTAAPFAAAGENPCTTADCGAGMLDAGAAVEAAASTVTGTDPAAALSAPATILIGATGQLRLVSASPATPELRVIGEHCAVGAPAADGADTVWTISTASRGACRLLLHQPSAGGYASVYRSASLRVVGMAAPVTFAIGDCSGGPCAIDGSDDYQLLTASAAGDQSFYYESSTPESCIVETSPWNGDAFNPWDGQPSISLYGVGTCSITAESSGDETYEGASASASATVVRGTSTTITVTGMGHGGMIRVGDGQGVWVRHSATGDLTVSSSTPGVCTVDESWYAIVYLEIADTGSCTLHAEGAATDYADAPAPVDVTIPVVLAYKEGAPALTLYDVNAYSNAVVYTNSLTVYADGIWPDMTTALRLGNNRSVCSTGTRLIPNYEWVNFTLPAGADGLRTVYACFAPGTAVYADSIILDRSLPSLRSASFSTRSFHSGSSHFVRIDWAATDKTSGIAGLEVAMADGSYLAGVISGGSPTWVRVRNGTASLKVRAYDRAGNASAWRTVSIPSRRR